MCVPFWPERPTNNFRWKVNFSCQGFCFFLLYTNCVYISRDIYLWFAYFKTVLRSHWIKEITFLLNYSAEDWSFDYLTYELRTCFSAYTFCDFDLNLFRVLLKLYISFSFRYCVCSSNSCPTNSMLWVQSIKSVRNFGKWWYNDERDM